MNIQEFIPRYKQIKSEGFIEITRNGDGKFGNTFEDLLGLEENNLKTPDIDGYELKVQDKETGSKQTLFNKDAWVIKASDFLKNYGIPHSTKKGELSCNTTVTRNVNNRGFYLDTDDDYLYVKHKDTIICQLDEGGSLDMELTVDTGKGYVPGDKHRDEDVAIGLISVDAMFSPIRKVSYKVDSTR